MKILILIFLLIPSLIIAKERLLVCKNFFGDGGEVIFKHKDSLIKKDFFTPRLISLENIIVGVLISNLTNLEKQKLI